MLSIVDLNARALEMMLRHIAIVSSSPFPSDDTHGHCLHQGGAT